MLVARAAKTGAAPAKKEKKQKPKLSSFLDNRDYLGAITLLEFNRKTGEGDESTLQWLAYAAFHGGDYKKALEVIDQMFQQDEADSRLHIFKACCLFYLGHYQEAETEALAATTEPPSRLQIRLLFHISHRLNDENKLMMYHQKLQDSVDDQLSLSAIHCLRGHYQEAIDIYKRILLENREHIALNVYVALCYYKLDYYDVSLEVLHTYLRQFPDSTIAINLKACNTFRLYNGKAAEQEMKPLLDTTNVATMYGGELIRHNLVVFRSGEGALQVLPPLLDAIPEARLNLVIFHLKNGELAEAFKLMKDLEPTTPQEYILKGVVNAALGQEQDNREMVKVAQQYFQLVGASASECDTIPGRQCMASCFYLMKNWDDVLLYLKSIKTYFYNDDDFNWNLGVAKSAAGQYAEGEEALLLVQSEKHKNEFIYMSHLARCFIHNNKARQAWELYMRLENTSEAFNLLQLIANDCYKNNHFLYAARAFDVLERLDPNPDYWEGKRGACVGVFQQVIAGTEPRELLRDVVTMLRNTNNPQVEYILRIMRKWAKENGLRL